MEYKRCLNPDKPEFMSPNTPAMVIGLFLLFFSIIVGIATASRSSGNIDSILLGGLCLLGFAGLIISLLRKGIRVDHSMGELERWWGLPYIPLIRSRVEPASYKRVEIRRTRHNTKNGHYYTYPVVLNSVNEQEKSVTVSDFRNSMDARNCGEACAKTLRLDLRDASLEREIIRSFDELNLSIRELAKKKGKSPSLKDAGKIPDSLEDCAKIQNGNLELKMPPSKVANIFIALSIAVGLFCVIFFSSVLIGVLRSNNAHGLFYLALLFPLIPGTIVFFVFKKKFAGFKDFTELYATPNSLSIKSEKLELEWNAKDIEQLMLFEPGTGQIPENTPEFVRAFASSFSKGRIIVCSDALYASFGNSLKPQELKWLYKTLYGLLAGEESKKH